jgi:hypothetical protein
MIELRNAYKNPKGNHLEDIIVNVSKILSRVYGSVSNNNGVLDWMIGFINTFFYNLS